MSAEIERKFRVVGDAWRTLGTGTPFRQGFLSTIKERVVRVRRAGEKGSITVKGVTRGITRLEFDYEIPAADADRMLDDLCHQPIIEKTRYRIDHGGLTWEVDEFAGENAGLIVAEVELTSEEQAFDKPGWVGEEVSGDPRYFNSNLVSHPYNRWQRG